MDNIPFAFFVLSFIVAWTIWGIGLVIYRFHFHPLAKFPGPKLAIATYWYEFYFDVIRGAKYTWKLYELHDQYGPIIRLNPDELHINDPEYFDKLYLGLKGRVEKPLRAAESFGPVASVFGTVDHDLHRTRRAPLDRLFSRKLVQELQPWIVSAIEKLCTRLQSTVDSGGTINLKYAYLALTRDIIYQYCFSRPLSSVNQPDFDKPYLDAVEAGPQITPLIFHLHWFGVLLHSIPGWLAKAISPGFSLTLRELAKMSLQIEAIRGGQDDAHRYSDHPTVFHELLNSNMPEREKAKNRIRDEAQTIIGAVPPLPDLEQLPYLTAVVLEGLRLGNVSAFRLLRAHPDTALNYGHLTIPAGTTVSMTPLHVHENPKIFPEPCVFRPERWLVPAQQGLRRYLVAFAKGKRACLGKHVAWAELCLSVAMVFRRFDFELVDTVKERDWTVSRATVVGSVSHDSKGVMAGVRMPEVWRKE
ncbi:MAG: hypothetical protein LQ343_005078 [Gyalolechia ehrenbergii]|nr:MAG: hypothetical protein LQ343_005078 [Gyalolechia ehrenbergii]